MIKLVSTQIQSYESEWEHTNLKIVASLSEKYNTAHLGTMTPHMVSQ
jgi:hypothetical protein